MDKRILLLGGGLFCMLVSFEIVHAYTITVHNRLPEDVIVKFDHAASSDNHKMVPANSTFELNAGIKCTRGIELESGTKFGAKADTPGGNCRSVTFWITRNKDKAKVIETR